MCVRERLKSGPYAGISPLMMYRCSPARDRMQVVVVVELEQSPNRQAGTPSVLSGDPEFQSHGAGSNSITRSRSMTYLSYLGPAVSFDVL